MEEKGTELITKNFSPLVIRKRHIWGWPLYVGMICDDNLSDIDQVIIDFKNKNSRPKNIQEIRNFTGGLNELLIEKYPNTEGAAVVWYVDKCMISSLWGDFMTHNMCRNEFYTLLQMMCHV